MVCGVLRHLELPVSPLEGSPEGGGSLLHELQLAFQQHNLLSRIVQLDLELNGRVSPGKGPALDGHWRNGQRGRARTEV